jgi:subtilisin family serine protease
MAQLGPVLSGIRRIVRELGHGRAALSPDFLSDQPVRISNDFGIPAIDVLLTAGKGGSRDFSRLEDQLRIGAIAGTVATAAARLDLLDEIAEVRSDAYVEAAALVYPEAADQTSSSLGDIQQKPRTLGAGVIIGIIDVGVDVSHPCLRDDRGGTRVLRLWDQGMVLNNPQRASGGAVVYGVQWPKEIIDAMLRKPGSLQSSLPSPSDHGTQVASIAAGNGGPSPRRKHAGIAPGADLVVVAVDAPAALLPSTRNLLDALTYIFGVADELGRPAVVNMSLGGWRGPHDATGQTEQFISALLKGKDTRIIVKSSGNTAGIGQHTTVTIVTGSTAQVDIYVPQNAGRIQLIELWYPLGDRLLCDVLDPNFAGIGPPVGPNQPRYAAIGKDAIEIDHIVNSTEAMRLNKISIKLTAGGTHLTDGIWHILLHAEQVARSGIVHGWIERSRGEQPAFISADDAYTVTSPATSPEMIVVGSFGETAGIARISPFSGRGPSRDGSSLTLIAARGEEIYSAVSMRRSRTYRRATGTSFATAQVTGAIALMLAAKRAATRRDVIRCLTTTCQPDMRAVPGANSSWGSGALNIDGALNAIRRSNRRRGP